MHITTATQHYTRPIVARETQLTHIGNAYRQAGLTPPDRTLDMDRLIEAAETIPDIMRDVATNAATAPDPAAYYQATLERVKTAQAADAIRQTWGKARDLNSRDTLPAVIDQAAADLTPAFTKTVKQLKAAADKLDRTRPLDVETALNSDTGAALTAARTALTALGAYTGIHASSAPPRNTDPRLATILPILNLPDITPEQIDSAVTRNPKVANHADSEHARTTRTIARGLADDQDATLIAIARGDFPGFDLTLANTSEHHRRRQQASNAFTRDLI